MSYALGIDIGASLVSAAVQHSLDHAAESFCFDAGTTVCPATVFFAEGGVIVGAEADLLGLAQPDRVVRNYLARVGDDVPITVAGVSIAAEDLVALVARWVVDRVSLAYGDEPESITVAYPANWGEYRSLLLAQSLAGVGMASTQLIGMAQAAVIHCENIDELPAGSITAVYDLGHAFSVALVEKMPGGETLSRGSGYSEERGGRDFDDVVFAHVSSSLGSALSDVDLADTSTRAALVRLRHECANAKELLSFDSEVLIPVNLPTLQTDIRLVRFEFERLIDTMVRDTVRATEAELDRVGLDAGDLAAIVLVGGSAQTPLVAGLLTEAFQRPIFIGADPGSSVALGAAAHAAQHLPGARGEIAIAGVQPVRSTKAWLAAHSKLPLTLAAVALGLVIASPGALSTREAATMTPHTQAIQSRVPTTSPSELQPSQGSPVPSPDGTDNRSSSQADGAVPEDARGSSTPPAAPSATSDSSQPSAEPTPEPTADPEPEPEPTPEPEPEPEPTPDPDPLPGPVEAPGTGVPTE